MTSNRSKFLSCKLTDLSKQIEKFWTIEDVDARQLLSVEETKCEEHFTQTTTRDESGRYIVRLPFRENHKTLGDSRVNALRRFHALERKFSRDPSLKAEYFSVMKEYIELKHMSVATGDLNNGYFLPHHAVIKEASATTKVRVVFDASAKTTTGKSLNDILMTGPTIQDKLFEHLIRFRVHKYVITADIEKMYRQIMIKPEDRIFQRLFWRVNDQIQVFELNTVTFGVSSAPFLGIRTIQQLADDEGARFPIAEKILKRDLYVDDLLTGADSLEEILTIRNEVIGILNCGGFNIRKWASNHEHALDRLNKEAVNLDLFHNDSSVLKPLGVVWNARSDKLLYAVNPAYGSDKITKRYILSEIAKIFDPLGLLSPVVLHAKGIMQEIWKSKISWDESVPSNLHFSWNAFASQLKLLNTLSIDRHLIINEPEDIQIHGFCDASKIGYGACLYLRSRNHNQNTIVRLICAKSRVTPIKEITIPRARTPVEP